MVHRLFLKDFIQVYQMEYLFLKRNIHCIGILNINNMCDYKKWPYKSNFALTRIIFSCKKGFLPFSAKMEV